METTCSRSQELKNWEKQAKFLVKRLYNDEAQLEKLHAALENFITRTAKYRDACDQLAHVMNDYASAEQINKSMKTCGEGLARCFARIGDNRNDSTKYLEEQVMTLFSQYDGKFKGFKAEVLKNRNAKHKEIGKRQYATRMRRTLPHNSKLLVKVEADLVDACNKMTKSQADLEEYSLSFENGKLADLKMALDNFLKAELAFHVDAVKTYTEAFGHLREVDTDKDFQDFKNVLVVSNPAFRLDDVRNAANCLEGRRRSGIPISSSEDREELRRQPAAVTSGASQSLGPTSEWNLSGLSPTMENCETSSGEDIEEHEHSEDEFTSSRTAR